MSSDRSLMPILERLPVPLDLPRPPTDFRRPMIAGMAVIAVAFGGVGGWAALAPLDSAVVAQGVVAVDSKRKTIQHREGGIVSELLVREGDKVEAGAPLVRLDDAGALATRDTVRLQLDTRRAERARLIAERDGLQWVVFPEGLDAETVAREADRFNQRRISLSGQRSILEARIAQLEAQRDGRTGLEDSARRQLELLRDEIAGLRGLEAKGYFPRNKLREKERELLRMEGEMTSDGAGASQTDKEIAETRLQILQLDQKQREEVVAEFAKVEADVADLTAKLAAAEDAVARLTVAAPVAGIVQTLAVAGPGAVVAPNGQVAEIVPGDDRLVVESRISPAEIDRVHTGQEARLRFTAFGARETPVIEGEVDLVSADRNTDQATRESWYTARIEVPEDQLSRLPRALRAGMPVEVMIKGGERTALEYLLKPLLDSFARGFNER